MAEWSGPHFTRFLKELLTKHGIEHLHIIAHSMGNQILVRSLFAGRLTAVEQSHLGQVVLAAPDVDRLIFDQQVVVASIKPLRVTLYASNRDQALLASKILHWGSRLGDARPTIDLQQGMDSIDASAVDTGFLGHSYIGSSRSVLVDVAALISSNTGPGSRFGVITQGLPPRQWWLLNP
jgi:esterase/lipase superfamily enzyme